MKIIRILWIPILLMGVGCIEDEIYPTLYLEPEGSAEWVVYVSQVKSDEKEVTKRRQEEIEFLDSFDKGEDYISDIFREAGATQIERHLIRDRAPFEYAIRARFDRAEDVWRMLFEDEKGIKWEPVRTDDQVGWRFKVDGVERLSDKVEEPVVEIVVVGGYAQRTLDGETVDLDRVRIINETSFHGLELLW